MCVLKKKALPTSVPWQFWVSILKTKRCLDISFRCFKPQWDCEIRKGLKNKNLKKGTKNKINNSCQGGIWKCPTTVGGKCLHDVVMVSMLKAAEYTPWRQ